MKTIIAATDFSTAGNNAVDYALDLAVLFNCRLLIVNAYKVSPPVYLLGESFLKLDDGKQADRIAEEKKKVFEKMEKLRTKLCAKYTYIFNIACVAGMGSPEEVIEQLAVEGNADLIVMGIVGEAGNIKQRLIGSTAINVARNGSVPTFIIPENIKYAPIHKISFACDLEEAEKTDLLIRAQHYGSLFKAELEIVTVDTEDDLVAEEMELVDSYADEQLTMIKHTITHLEGRRVARKLENYFWDHPADLIMLSPKKHPVFHHLFNPSITTELAFNARTPILTIK